MSNSIEIQIREAIIKDNVNFIINIITKGIYDPVQPIDSNGLSALHYAVQNSKEKVIECLLSHMNDVNLVDSLGRTPLHYAAAKNDKKIIKYLLAAGANVNILTIGGETALMKAIMFNRTEAVHLLLRFGSDIFMINNSGQDIKTLAFMTKNEEIKQMVLIYEDVFLYSYMKLQNSSRANFINRLTPEMIKKLTRYIIP